jgi:tetratricopeptide (TPR) repeat protein
MVTAARRGGKLRLGNVRVRKLTYGPPPRIEDAKYAECVEYYSQAIEDNPGYSAPYRLRGMSHYFLGQYEHALPDFRKVVELDPEARGALVFVGDTLRGLGRYSEAIDSLQSAIAKEPQEPSAYATLCLIFAACPDAKLRDVPQAMRLGTKARELNAKSSLATLSLATAHAAAGRFADATRLARESISQADASDRPEIERRLKLFESRKPYLLEPGGKPKK